MKNLETPGKTGRVDRYVNGPDKKPRQNNIHSNKKPRVHVRRRTAVRQCNETFLARCHKDFALIG